MDEAAQYEFEERAAIIQFDMRLTREESEAMARSQQVAKNRNLDIPPITLTRAEMNVLAQIRHCGGLRMDAVESQTKAALTRLVRKGLIRMNEAGVFVEKVGP